MWAADRLKRYGCSSGRGKLILCQSIFIDETNTFQVKFFFWHENCGRDRFRRFVSVSVDVAYSRNKLACGTLLKQTCAWHPAETNLRLGIFA